MSVLSLSKAKEHLAITVGTFDVQLQGFIDAAESAIAAKCGPLSPTSVTEEAVAVGGRMMLATPPAISLTSVIPIGGSTPIDLSSLSLNHSSGIASGVPSGVYTVAYSAGRSTCPVDLLMAVKELVRHLWDTQRGPTRRPGSTTSEMTANTIPGAAYMMPFRVAELIAPHMQPGFA